MTNSNDKYIEEEFNIFKIIELIIKRKILVSIIIILSAIIGYFYQSNTINYNTHAAIINIEEGSNWEKEFVKDFKVLVLYDSPDDNADPDTKIDINNVDVTLKEFITYRYYDFKGYQDSIINVSSKNLYNQFGALINNKVMLNEIVQNSDSFKILSDYKKQEIINILNAIIISYEKNPFENNNKIIIELSNISPYYKENRENFNFIINELQNYLKNLIITQLEILLSTYMSSIEKDFYAQKESNKKLLEIIMFQLKTQYEIAKNFNIKKNTSIQLNEMSRDYYLKGYELIGQEIFVLEKEIERNNNLEMDPNEDNVFINYLRNDINIMQESSKNFDIIKYDVNQFPISTFDRSYLIYGLSLIIGLFISILITLTLENFLIYKKNKKS